MIQETAGWLLLIVAVIGYAIAFAVPATRPYAKKLWWVMVLAVVASVGLVALRRSPGRKDTSEAKEGGEAIQEATEGAIDSLVDKAREEMARSDAELARNRLHSEQERKEFDAKLEAVAEVDDSLERRKALVKLVGKA